VDDDDGTDVFEVAPLHAVRATLKQAATTNGLTASAFMSLPEYAGRRSGMRVPVGGAVSCARSRPTQTSGDVPGPQLSLDGALNRPMTGLRASPGPCR
jgi:hypothetical protein